jgi:predicted lipoprotein with Yx(FWY)xxD motif
MAEATEEPTMAAEPTMEPTEEATMEATEEATAEATMEATEEATMEATEEATTEATGEATMEATAEATMEGTAEATGEATAEATAGATGPATVMVASNEQLGDILVDAEGMTLYLFTNDTPNTSNCYDQCAVNWPPLLTEGDPEAGEGADSALLGTTTRTDGTTQVTYNGWPLYYYIQDENAGDVTGQDVGGVWFVVSPAGEQVATP